MKNIVAILSLILLTNVAYSAENLTKCNENSNQMQLNNCAYNDFKKADKSLNKVYNALRKAKKQDKLFLKNLKRAENAWIVYRDANLNAEFTCEGGDMRYCFGSMYPLLRNTSKTLLTKQRVKILQAQLNNANM